MKIERLLTITQDSKGNDIARVQDLTNDQIKIIDREKFKEAKSTKNKSRLQAEAYVILKEDFNNYENQMNEKIKSLEDVIEDKNQTIKKLEDKLSAIDEDYKKQIENIKQENYAKIDELKEDLHDKDLEIEKTKTRYEKEIGVFREDIQKEINDLDLYDKEKHMKIKDHEKEVKGIKDKIVRETIINNDRINELEKGLTITGFIRGKYKTPLQDLKKGIEHFQHIAQYSETYENQVLNVKDKEDK